MIKLLRIFAVIPVFIYMLIYLVYIAFYRSYLFLRYGGEMITYDKEVNKKTVLNVYEEITKKQCTSHYYGSSRSVKDGIELRQCIKCKRWSPTI